MIRPGPLRFLRNHAELIAATTALGFGLWIMLRGGWFFALIGAALGLVAAIWLIGAYRRGRFRRDITGEGVVEIDEGAIRYYGASLLGGEIALRDLIEIRLLDLEGQTHWRLRAADGQALIIPIDAKGAAGLADAFCVLPGLDLGVVSAALAQHDAGATPLQSLWRRRD